MTTVPQSMPTTVQQSATRYARRRLFERIGQAALVYAILSAVAFIFLLPFVWMVLSAIKSAQEVAYFPPTIIPRQILLSNFVDAWTHPDMRFTRWLWNTVYISGAVLIGTLLTASLCAYGFARIQFPGRGFWFIATIASVMLPPQVTLIPLYVLFFQIGWLNTFHPLVIPAWFGGGALNIFLLRQFFLQIPTELEDAAYIDGANRLHIWWRIFLPLSVPALLTVAIFTFQGTWNDFYGPLIFLTGRDKFTLSLGMNLFNSQYGAQVHYMMAIATLMSLPMIVVFFVAQRYFIGGIVLSGVNR